MLYTKNEDQGLFYNRPFPSFWHTSYNEVLQSHDIKNVILFNKKVKKDEISNVKGPSGPWRQMFARRLSSPFCDPEGQKNVHFTMKMDLFSIQRVQNLTKDRLATIFNVARHGDPKKRIPKRHFASHFCKK